MFNNIIRTKLFLWLQADLIIHKTWSSSVLQWVNVSVEFVEFTLPELLHRKPARPRMCVCLHLVVNEQSANWLTILAKKINK